MSWADIVNGSYEFLASLFMLNNCRVLYNDKKVRGVSLVSTVFFTSWGVWNLYYYPSLNQWISFFGGASLVMMNAIYVGLMIYYEKKEKRI
jgi:hypothetical protein